MSRVTCVMNTCLLERLNLPMFFNTSGVTLDRLTSHELPLYKELLRICAVSRARALFVVEFEES